MFVSMILTLASVSFAQDSNFSACAGQLVDADRVGKFYLSAEAVKDCQNNLGLVEIINDTDYFLTPEIGGVPWSDILIQGDDGLPITVKTSANLYKSGLPPRSLTGPSKVVGFVPTGNSKTKVAVSATGYAVNSDVSWSESLIDAPLGFYMHIMSLASVSINTDAVQLEGSEVSLSCKEVSYSVTPNIDGNHLPVDPVTGFHYIRFTQGAFPCR